MMLICYPSMKALKMEIGKPLRYRETSAYGAEFTPNGTFSAAYRPSLWRHDLGGREFFAQVTMQGGLISKVK